MINGEMKNLLKQSKLYVDVIELDTQSTITDNLKIVHDRLKKLINTTSNNLEIMHMLKLIKTKVNSNSQQFSELKNTLILFLS